MRLVIERATSRGSGRGKAGAGVVTVAGGALHGPLQWRLRCLRHQLKFVSPGAVHSIKLNALPKIVWAAFFGIRLSRVDWLLSLLSVSLRAVFSTHLPTGYSASLPSPHTASPAVLCLFLSLNRMSSLNPLMTISFDDISPSSHHPSYSLIVVSLYFLLHMHKFVGFW